MPTVFPLTLSYGARVSLKFPHELKQTVQGYDFLNVQNTRPVLEFDVSRNLIYEADKDAVLNLFETLQGSQDYFLFEDFSDYQATASILYMGKEELYPTVDGYDRGITQGVLIRDIDDNVRLAKKYQLGTSISYRVITHVNTIQVYRGGLPVSVTVEEGTGIVTGGNPDTDTWDGTFYVPVRFVEDDFSYTKVGNNHYAFNSLRLREVKLFNVGIADTFVRTSNSYFSLAFNFNSETTKKFKTIVTNYDNDFEEREQQFDYLEQRFTLSQRKLLDRLDVEYLITLFRCYLGSFTVFKYYRFEDYDTFDVCLESPLEITVSMKKNTLNKVLYEVNNLILKSTRLDDIEKLRTTLCKTWEIIPKTGVSYKVTDCDIDLEIGLNRYTPMNPLKGYAVTMTNNFDVDNTETEGVFSLTGIDEEDLIAGRFEDASININLADWYAKSIFKNIFSGYIGSQTVNYTKYGGRNFKFEVLSLIRDLNKNNSNVTSSRCRHKFLEQGYGKCNRPFTIDSAPGAGVRVRTTISGVINNVTIQAGAGGDSWEGFARGTVLFETGKLTGTEILISTGSGLTINLMFGMKVLPSVGDQILVTKDCDKSLGACQGYNNVENFGGFPRMPGFDGIIKVAESEG